jgi:hypothetical protein
MLVAQAAVQSAQPAGVAVLLLAVILVIFWRAALKLAVAVVAVGVIALVGYGAIVIWENMHHVVR